MDKIDDILEMVRSADDLNRERMISAAAEDAFNRVRIAILESLRIVSEIRLARGLRRSSEAQEIARRAVALARVMGDAPLLRRALLVLARGLETAEETRVLALEACQPIFEGDQVASDVQGEAAGLLIWARDYAAASRLLAPLAAQRTEDADFAGILWNYSVALRGEGRFGEAVVAARQALDESRRAKDDPRFSACVALDGADAAIDAADDVSVEEFLRAMPRALPSKIAFRRSLVEARRAAALGDYSGKINRAREAMEFATKKWGADSNEARTARALLEGQ